MALLSAFLALVAATAVHEAGHWLAIRLKHGRVLLVQVGRGPALWRRAGERTSLVLSAVPFGGRIAYDGIPAGTGQAVVAISGAVANLALAVLAFLAAALLAPALLAPGLTATGAGYGPLAYATGSTGSWFWAVPGALVELVATGSATALRADVRALASLLAGRPLLALPYALGALSALWAGLNLIPLPVLRTDGWHVLRALWSAR
jgi:membrane-associated protease RseP (regulator of RpoE activity)